MYNYGSLIDVPIYDDEMEQHEEEVSLLKQIDNNEDDFTTKILAVKILDKLTELSTKMTNIERLLLLSTNGRQQRAEI